MKRTPAWEAKDGTFHRDRRDAKKADALFEVREWIKVTGFGGGGELSAQLCLEGLTRGATALAPLLAAYAKAEAACAKLEPAEEVVEIDDEGVVHTLGMSPAGALDLAKDGTS